MGEKIAFINPKIVAASKGEVESYEEGCLSLPDIQVDVVRPKRVTVEYLDTEGKPCRLDANGMLARCIQHESDHLEGTLIVDRAQTSKEKQRLIDLVEELEEAYV
jgi:peptide deformylase